jgi:hypothetical protein
VRYSSPALQGFLGTYTAIRSTKFGIDGRWHLRVLVVDIKTISSYILFLVVYDQQYMYHQHHHDPCADDGQAHDKNSHLTGDRRSRKTTSSPTRTRSRREALAWNETAVAVASTEPGSRNSMFGIDISLHATAHSNFWSNNMTMQYHGLKYRIRMCWSITLV